MKLKRTALILSIFLVFLLCISTISAADNASDGTSGLSNLNTPDLKSSHESDVLSDEDVGTFTELANLISTTSSGGEINLTKDYQFVSADSAYSSGISINKKLTINGNGHTIDASNKGRIFSISGSNVVLNNITFTNPYQYNNFGSAVYSTGSYLKIYNCNFDKCDATYAAAYLGGYNPQVVNSTFTNCTAYGATTIYCVGSSGLIDNCTFANNVATYESGGAVYIYGSSATVKNSVFINNSATTRTGLTGGGALYIYGNYVTVDNCEFYNNTQKKSHGGALYWGGRYGTLKNSIFINNTNTAADGGAVTVLGFYNTLYNNYYESNTAATQGGGLNSNAYGTTIYNETFINNVAHTGGGARLDYNYYESIDYDNSRTTITNSVFINNTAIYGGGGFDASSKVVASNIQLINNTANNYGGGASVSHSTLDNITFIGNNATFGGGAYILDVSLSNSNFTNNTAAYGNSIYIITKADLTNNTYLEEDYYFKEKEVNGTVIGTHEIQNMLTTAEGYFGFCSEAYNSKPYSGEYDHSMEVLKNSINGQPVAEYLKILIYQFVDHIDDLKKTGFHNYVWAFTDREYWNNDDPIVQHVIELYDSGFRVPTVNACKVLANGTLMYINYSSIITPSAQQNLFLFKFDHGDVINETLTKESLNKTAFVGDDVEFRIVVSNKGKSPIYSLWVEDKDYSKGLMYESWESEIGNWTYDNLTGHWILDELQPGKSASIILTFKVMINGTLYNNATSGVGDTNITVDSNETIVYNPNFTVQKITLNKTVELGELVEFEILVNNTGDIELTELFVEEKPYEGLVYHSWTGDKQWTYSNSSGKNIWTFNGNLPVGEVTGFIVLFNTTAYGNLTNVVVASSNETDNKTGNNTTYVLKPDFIVQKNVLTPYVVVGNQTKFEIIVRNTGEVDLDDIVVIEDDYYGLTYDYADTGDIWEHTTVDGKHAWKLNSVLKPGSEEFFFVYFNTTIVGNFTNYVIATSNKTDNRTGNNTTEVNKTVPEDGNYSNYTVEKITIDKTVVVGELVEFQILVKNTGNATIHNLTIYESKYDGLTYHSYHDHFDLWIFNEDEMSWTLNDDFYPGEEIGLHVYFNTTQTGTFTNVVVVTSNETDNKTDNDTVKVLKPGINIEKNALNKTVIVGQQVTFEIIVHNTGEEVLNDVIVRELDFKGLIYDHFDDYSGFWSKNDDLSWTLTRPLAIDEYEGFFVTFNTTKRGNFTNYASVHTNETDNDTDNDTVQVLGYNLTVSKITINKTVKVGDNIEFEIVVTNTGDLDLENVFVSESKYDSGLVYKSYKNVNGNWVYSLSDNKPTFTLGDLLKVGESARFRAVFKTTKSGNFSNTVEAGYNNTTVCNSTNTTEVINKTIPDNPDNNKTNDKNKTKNKTNKTKEPFERLKVDEKATGNPIALLLLVLIMVPIKRLIK